MGNFGGTHMLFHSLIYENEYTFTLNASDIIRFTCRKGRN